MNANWYKMNLSLSLVLIPQFLVSSNPCPALLFDCDLRQELQNSLES
jgi:hypothetical protein